MEKSDLRIIDINDEVIYLSKTLCRYWKEDYMYIKPYLNNSLFKFSTIIGWYVAGKKRSTEYSVSQNAKTLYLGMKCIYIYWNLVSIQKWADKGRRIVWIWGSLLRA